MAQLVAGVGVPHSPHYPSQFAKDGPEETPRALQRGQGCARCCAARRDRHHRQRPLQHFLPEQFSDLRHRRQREDVRSERSDQDADYDFKVQSALAAPYPQGRYRAGFDFAVVAGIRNGPRDDGAAALSHRRRNRRRWCRSGSTPSSSRCRPRAAAMRSAICCAARSTALPRDLRVVVLASGSFSLEVAGPRIDHARTRQRSRHRMVTAPARRIKNGESTNSGRRSDARADVAGRQYRRRTVELDRHARHVGKRSRTISPTTTKGRARLCGLAWNFES